jgi:hypothetical protein
MTPCHAPNEDGNNGNEIQKLLATQTQLIQLLNPNMTNHNKNNHHNNNPP